MFVAVGQLRSVMRVRRRAAPFHQTQPEPRERDGEMDKRAGNGPRKAICRIHKFLSPWCPSFAEVNASCYLESAFLLALKVSASARRRLRVRQLPQGLALGATGNWAH